MALWDLVVSFGYDQVFGGLDTRDGNGWVVRVDGEMVAWAASIGALEDALREWVDVGLPGSKPRRTSPSHGS